MSTHPCRESKIFFTERKKKIRKTMTYIGTIMYIGACSIIIIWHCYCVRRARAILSLYGGGGGVVVPTPWNSDRLQYNIIHGTPGRTHSRWVFEKKGLSLYSLWFFFLFFWPIASTCGLHNLPLQGALVPRLPLVAGQILRCGTHTRTLYPLYIIRVHMQHKYPVRYAVVF